VLRYTSHVDLKRHPIGLLDQFTTVSLSVTPSRIDGVYPGGRVLHVVAESHMVAPYREALQMGRAIMGGALLLLTTKAVLRGYLDISEREGRAS